MGAISLLCVFLVAIDWPLPPSFAHGISVGVTCVLVIRRIATWVDRGEKGRKGEQR